MFAKLLRSAVLAAFAVGAGVAQAHPYDAAPAQATGYLTFLGSSEGSYVTVPSLALSGMIGGSPRNQAAGQFKGYFDSDMTDTLRNRRLLSLLLHRPLPLGPERHDPIHAHLDQRLLGR